MAYFGNIGENIIENINSKMRKKVSVLFLFSFFMKQELKKALRLLE